MRKHEVRHHTHADETKGKNSNKLFQDVASAVKEAQEILVLGPGQGKNHFIGFLKDHHAKDIANHVVGVETVDHPTDNQIMDYSRKFFKKFDLFH